MSLVKTESIQLDLDYIRAQFPALKNGYTYFDNAGGSQTLKLVADRITDYLLTDNVQLGASYSASQRAGKRVAEANQGIANLINAKHVEEVIMGSSTTLLLRILSICIGKTLSKGDEIIVTGTEHESNRSPWLDLEKEIGIQVKEWLPNSMSNRLELEDLENLMNERTKLVTITHTSNIYGTINPVKEISRLVHSKNALICVDGVAYAPHRAVDVQELEVDFYVYSFYKVFGPHHAVMYGRKELLLELPGINHYFITNDDIPYKFQPGNLNYELSYGVLGIVDYLENLSDHHLAEQSGNTSKEKIQNAFELITQQEERLSEKLLTYLRGKQNVKIIGEEGHDSSLRVPTVSFVVEGIKSDVIVAKVDAQDIGIRYGDFYAKRIVEHQDLTAYNGVVRVSMVHYNTLQEVDQLIQAFETIF